MREFQSTMSKIVKDHKKGKRYLAFLVALSMIVSVAVPFSLIMPAISMTYDDETFQEDDFDNLLEDSDGLTLVSLSNTNSVSMAPPTGYESAVNVATADSKNVTFNSNQNPLPDVIPGNSIDVEVSIDYHFDKSTITGKFPVDATGSPSGNKCLIIDVSSLNATFVLDDNSKTGNIDAEDAYRNSSWNTQNVNYSGTFVIQDDGWIIITLTDDYIKYLNAMGGDLTGSIAFEGTMSRSEDGDNVNRYDILGQEITVTFQEQNPTLNKWNTVKDDGTIEWTVTINNEDELDLSKYTLEDDMLTGATVTFSPDTVNGVHNGNTITFPENTKDKQVTITYTTNITNEQLQDSNNGNGSRTNTAKLKKDDKEVDEKESHAQFNKQPITVDKTGEADYQDGTTYEGNVNWEIRVSSNYGTSLQDYIIEDDKIPDTGVEITPSGVSLMPAGAGTWRLNFDENVSASEVVINYQTKAVSNIEGMTETAHVDNTVKVRYPDGGEGGEGHDDVDYKKKSDLVDLDKNGHYDHDTHEITWTITVTPHDGFSLNGYTLTDDKFPASKDDLTVTWWSDIKDQVELVGNTLKFKEDCNIKTGTVTITYTQPIAISELPAAGTEITVTNNVDDSNGNHKEGKEKVEGSRTILNKTLDGNTTESVANNGKLTRTLYWTASITYDESLAGQVYTDTPSVEGDNATHVLNEDSIVVKVRKTEYGSETTLKKGEGYTVEKNGDSFTIKFADGLDATYNYATITYNTTATMEAPQNKDNFEPIEYKFKNKGEFNGKTSEGDGFTLTRTNPNVTTRMDLGVNKVWSDNDNAANKRPGNVIFKLKYCINGNGDWKDVKGSGTNYLFEGDNGYSDTSAYTITLTGSDSTWTANLTDLPKSITKAKPDGSQDAPVSYFYKLEEVSADGNSITNGYIKTDKGLYMVGDSNSLGYAGTLSVTNTYYKNVDITAEKIWSDTGNGGFTGDITVELLRSTNSNWDDADHLGTAVLTASNNWKLTSIPDAWKNLPTKEVDDNGKVVTYFYKLVETKFGNTTITENNQIVTVDNGYYKCDTTSVVGSGANFSGKLTVTNEFHETEKFTIDVDKTWSDNGNSDNRPDAIIVALQRKDESDTKWTTIDTQTLKVEGDTQSYTWSSYTDKEDGTTKELVSQEVIGGVAKTYSYRVVEIGYVQNETEYITNANGNNALEFSTNASKGYYTENNSKTEFKASGTASITNTFTPVGTIAITPQKKWVGGKKESTVTLRLKQKLGNNTLAQAKDADGNVINDIILTVGETQNVSETEETRTEWNTSSNAFETISDYTWTATEIANLPKMEITIGENGKIKKEYYSYQFVEVAEDGTELNNGDSFKVTDGNYVVTLQSAVDSTGTFVVTNTFKESVGALKSAIDGTGKKINSIDMEDLEQYKFTFEGKDYYIFNWMIELETNKIDLVTPILDILPDGFTLVEDARPLDYDATKSWYSTLEQAITGWGEKDASLTSPFEKDKYSEANTDPYYLSPCIVWPGQLVDYLKRMSMVYDDQIKDSDVDPNNKTNIAQTIKGAWNLPGYSPSRYYYDKDENKIYFGVPRLEGVPVYTYSTKIECDKLQEKLENGSFTITNNVEMYDNDGNPTDRNTSASLTIVNKTPSNLITKNYKSQGIPGYVGFSLDVNPDGKNLSNGDTIDIEDIFLTNSYTDADWDKSNKKTPSATVKDDPNLVDVLMNNINLYKVDIDGNKTKLDRSEYTLNFESNENGVTSQDNTDGAALLKLTIPDETHIVIEYVYKLIANNKTPSVLNGCKSSTRVSGKYPVMAPGMVPPAGDTVTFSNYAKLYSDSTSAEDSEKEIEYQISKSSGTISTNTLPKIKKVDVGNYGINNLEAKFLLARYDQTQQKWFYASKIENTEIKTWTEGVTGLQVATNATKIDVDTAYSHSLSLSQDTLYKLIEVQVPTGYEGSNLGLDNDAFEKLIVNYLNHNYPIYDGKDYTVFLDKYISTYYFVYNSVLNASAYPSEVETNKIIQVKSGEDIEIPNNQLIDIDVTKNWIGRTATDTDEVTVKLYWSFKKVSTGMPAADEVHEATAADLGIMGEFSAVQTVHVGENKSVWTNLPNGKDGKPIYYYVKETSYTIDSKTYTLDETTGKYKANEEEGAYYPTYVGNAANTDSNVTITNSKQLMLKKVWKNSSNDELSEGKIPVDQITVDIYGVTALGAEEKLFEEIKLERAKDWKLDITDKLEELGNKKLSGYVSFRAEETGLPNEDDYVISCVFNLNENTGDITVTNKSKVATEASVTVNKTWSDGAANHTKDKVLVTLYQSEREIQNISSMTHDELKNALKSAKVMTDAEGNTTGYEDIVLNAANDWSYTWTGLPMDDEGAEGADPNNPVTYYYYVLENMDSVTNNVKYTATYTPIKNGAKTTYTVKNTRTAIVVQKQWFDETGEPIIDIYDEDGNIVANNTDGLPSITLELYKQAADPLLADGCHPNTEGYAAIAKAYFDAIESQYSESKNTELKIVALGDSITHSYNTGTPYPEQLTTLLTNASYQLAGGNVTNKGNSGEQVGNSDTDGFRGRISRDIPSDTNIVLLLGGTNDIHQSGSGQANPNECMRRLQACIEEIQAHVPNATIFVGSIPHFDFYKNGAITEGGRWWPSQYQENDGKEANGLIDNYNAQIEAYAESANNVYYVDTCTAVDGKEYVVDKNGNRISVSLKKGNNWTAVVDVPDDGEYYIEEINVPDGWTVTYSGQGLKPGTATPIIAMNTKEKTPKTEISVVKNWVGDSADTSKRDGISLALMCSVDGTNWEEVAVDMPTPTKDGNTWTYTYENLPVTNNAGKTYSYKVEEAEMEGYKVQYDTPDIWQASKTETGTLTLTNTRQLALTLKKDWVGVDDPQGSISVNIYRSTNPADVPSDAELILKVPSTVSVGVNKDATVSANKTIASATSKDENIATVTFDDKTIIIHGNAEGTTTITVTDENDNTAEIKVTVSDMSLTISPSAIVLGTNETATLSIEKNIGNVTYSASSSDVSIDGNTVTVTGRNKGVVTITATDESGNTASVNLEIKLPNNFEIIGIDTIAPGDKVQLEVNPNYGSFKWSSSNSNIAEVDEITGEITGKAEGTATITAVRDDKLENYFTIKVENATPLHTLNAGEHFDITTNKAINSISFKLEGSTGYIDLYITSSDWSYQHGTVYYDGNVIENYQFTENYISASINGNIVTYDLSRTGKTSWGVYNNNDKSHVEELKERTSTIYVYSYTINYADGTSETFKVSSDPAKLSLQNVTTFYAFANGTEPEGANNDTELVKSVDITATTGWKTVVEDLDVYDAEGNLYYYWVVEESHVGFDVSYLFEDGDNTTIYAINATNPGDGAITIRNTKIESHEISMPSTGGPGVGRSHTVGAILMCGSTASYILARRRRNRRKRA